MLTACVGSGNSRPTSAPDPVIVSRTETVKICPAELRLAIDPRPQPTSDAIITGNDAGMAWLRQILERLGLVEARLADAAKECP